MKVIKAGIVKRIEFQNLNAVKRYLDNLRVDGKNYYIISEGESLTGDKYKHTYTIVETWRNAPLIKDVYLK